VFVVGQPIPYCGLPPEPGDLLYRFNFDPFLMLILANLALIHLLLIQQRQEQVRAITGWLIAAAAFISPLCALSVSLFSARVTQQMILVLVAAPLIALAGPPPAQHRVVKFPWTAAGAFFVALWLWHMPVPYDATFGSTRMYWLMHISLFGPAILLWRQLLHHAADRTAEALVVGALTSLHMGLLGALLAFAGHPMFLRHLTTTQAWGLSSMRDQQLGGLLMCVPGMILFLFVAVRSLGRLWTILHLEKPA
jgi:putative membrane protein